MEAPAAVGEVGAESGALATVVAVQAVARVVAGARAATNRVAAVARAGSEQLAVAGLAVVALQEVLPTPVRDKVLCPSPVSWQWSNC
ncbi:MAG: hypothetical protein ABI560_16970 [Myxococcales bacterium]